MASVLHGAIAIDGLNETIKGLKRVRPGLERKVGQFNRDRARQVLLPEAHANWSSQRIKPSVAGGAVKAGGGQRDAKFTIKYSTQPVAAGVAFGSLQFRQFRGWVGNQHTGAPGFNDYIVGPAFERKGDEYSDGMLDDLAEFLLKAIT